MLSSPPPRSGREAGGSIGATGCMRAPVKRSPHLHRSAANVIPSLRKPRGLTSLIDSTTSGDRANGGSAGPRGPVAAAVKPGNVEVRQVLIGGQSLQVAIRHSAGNQPPLLMFKGIGANWELAKPFLEALTHTTAIIFDVPGVGGSRPLTSRTLVSVGAHPLWRRFLAPCLRIQKFRSRRPASARNPSALAAVIPRFAPR